MKSDDFDWEQAIRLANCPKIDTLVHIAVEYAKRVREKSGMNNSERSMNNTTKTSSAVEVKEAQCRLNAEEREKIGQIISQDGTANVQIDDAYLFF